MSGMRTRAIKYVRFFFIMVLDIDYVWENLRNTRDDIEVTKIKNEGI
jgi:hypothetical protein